jgi:serine/threonine-protein kinase
VALKRLNEGCIHNPRALQTLRNEAAALSLADHPGVPKLIESSFERADPYIAMEVVKGKELAIDNPGTRRELLNTAIRICSILSSLHSAGIVHRDVKPAHIIVGGGKVSLIDFGIASVPGMPDFASIAIEAVGTPDFMAPEQTYPKARVDHRADIYSLGIIVYSFISGYYPYVVEDGSRESCFEVRRTREAVPLRARSGSFPASLSRALQTALAREPKDRFDSAADMADAISDALAEYSRAW